MKKKRILILFATILVGVLLTSLNWVYAKTSNSAGQGIAQVLTTITLQVVLFLFLVGVGLGGITNWARDNHRWIFKKAPKDGTWLAWYVKLWADAADVSTVSQMTIIKTEIVVDQELAAASKQPRRKGGRVHSYSYEVRKRTVLDWENRSPLSALTLPQYLEEKFGPTGNGTLKVPVGTFYDWRREILGLDKPKDTEELPASPDKN